MKKKILIPLGLVIVAAAVVASWDYSNNWSIAGRFFSQLANKDEKGAPVDSKRLCAAHGYLESVCFRCNPSAALKAKFAAEFDWCKEHTLPETQCEICDPFARFKAKGDWCAEHKTPESQCAQCNPSLVKPGSENPLLSVERVDQNPNSHTSSPNWCEHGFEKGNCFRCDPKLEANFKAAEDWCGGHKVPESQCADCNLDVEATVRERLAILKGTNPEWCEHGFEKGNCFRCDPKLEANFKTAEDWCGGHKVPESQCGECNEDVAAAVKVRLAFLKEIKPRWCEHGFEKGSCFRCDPKLEAKFKAAEDWCGGHKVPESQCSECNEDVAALVKEHLAQIADVKGADSNDSFLKFGYKPYASPLKSDFCTTHLLRVRLAGLDMASKVGLKFEATRKRAVREIVRCNGEVIYNTNRLARLSSRFDGIIESISVDVGEQVKADQVVAIVDSPALGEARSDYLQAVEELKVTQSVFEKISHIARQTQGMLKAVKPGLSAQEQLRAWQQFRAGAARSAISTALNKQEAVRTFLEAALKLHQQRKPLAEATRRMVGLLRGSKLSATEAQEKLKEFKVGDPKAALLAKLSELGLARAEFHRQEKLKANKVGTEKAWQQSKKESESAGFVWESLLEQTALSAERELLDLDASLKKSEQEVSAAEAKFDALQQELAVRSEMEVLQAKKELQLAESEVASARRRLRLFGLTSEEVEAGSSDSVSSHSLKTPFDGIVIERQAVKGEVKKSGETVVVIADLSTLWVKLDVFESELPRLKVGQPVRFRVDGLKDMNFEGKLTWLGSEVNDKTRMVNVRARIPNSEGLLKANMFGRAVVLVHQNDEVVTVPKDAVQWEGCHHVVFAKISENEFVPRKVQLGFEGPDFYEVMSGLSEGESVVTTGSFLLKTEILKSSIGAGCCE